MKIDVDKQVDYWISTASGDFDTAKSILKSGKNLHYSLFFCHLTQESYTNVDPKIF
ncbi:MAG: hypothetical protein QME25_01695 [Bacteroidota bacterium]|nr:hypothetical protein [Bacteroidota bacterium]